MKVIKEGDLNRLKKPVRFKCHECGCVFEAEKGEYKINFYRNDTHYSCDCPTCGCTVQF